MIPEGWERLPFSEVFRVANAKRTQVQKNSYQAVGRHPIVDQGQSLIAGYTDHHECYTNLPVIVFGDHTKAIKWIDFEFCPGADGTQILKPKEGIDPRFAFHLLENAEIPNLGYSRHMREVKNLEFLLPRDESEQRRIADGFKIWDRAIETVEALIANARAQKQALMQQLLPQGTTPPQKRLPGFSGEWREIRLGAAFSERVERGDNELPLLSVTQANGVIPQSEAGRRNISSDDQSNYKTVRAGDIAYNTMRMWQGASALSTLTGKVSPAYTIVTPRKGHDALFYAYLFKQPKMIHVFERHSQGLVSDTWNLKYPHFAKIRTCVPDIEEQRAIAAAFASLDDSTRDYEAQLTALRQEKAALMQQLLTGKRRVKLDSKDAV